jgi:hypothetical protein
VMALTRGLDSPDGLGGEWLGFTAGDRTHRL